MGVEPAGIGKNPEAACSNSLLLESDLRLGTVKSVPVETKPQKGDLPGPIAKNFKRKFFRAFPQFLVRQLVGSRGRAADNVRDAETRI